MDMQNDGSSHAWQPTDRDMHFYLESEQDITSLFLSGDIVIYQNAELKDAFQELQASGARQVIVDFSSVNYIDSASIGALMWFKSTMEKAGAHVLLCGLSRSVERIFEMNHLDQFFSIYETHSQARYMLTRHPAALHH